MCEQRHWGGKYVSWMGRGPCRRLSGRKCSAASSLESPESLRSLKHSKRVTFHVDQERRARNIRAYTHNLEGVDARRALWSPRKILFFSKRGC